MIKKEQGEKREFSTGAQKQNAEGKGTPVLFPPDAYIDMSKHFEAGAELHGSRNWEKGIPLSEIINSLERHIAQEKMGLTDERHDRAIAWNAIVYLATKLRIEAGILPKELDDIPKIYDNKPVEKEQEQKQEFEVCLNCCEFLTQCDGDNDLEYLSDCRLYIDLKQKKGEIK